MGDVARATLSALDGDVGGVFNVGTGIATSVLDLYEVCRWVAGSDAEPVHEAARAGELGRSVLDGERAAAEIGFRAETSLATGVASTWQSLQPAPLTTPREGARRPRANVSVVDVSLQHADRLIRPWRTAALVAAAVAAVELLVLVVVGGALIAKPSTGTASRPVAKTAAAKSAREGRSGEGASRRRSTGRAARGAGRSPCSC